MKHPSAPAGGQPSPAPAEAWASRSGEEAAYERVDEPIFVLVDRSSVCTPDVERLLDLGANILMVPDISAAVGWLLALRNAAQRRSGESAIRYRGLVVDLSSHAATFGDRDLHVSERELQTLALLAREPGAAVPFSQIVTQAWGELYVGDAMRVRQAIKRLRHKLAAGGISLRIDAVPGFGFRLSPEDEPKGANSDEATPASGGVR